MTRTRVLLEIEHEGDLDAHTFEQLTIDAMVAAWGPQSHWLVAACNVLTDVPPTVKVFEHAGVWEDVELPPGVRLVRYDDDYSESEAGDIVTDPWGRQAYAAYYGPWPEQESHG